jgi:hypothetical protein
MSSHNQCKPNLLHAREMIEPRAGPLGWAAGPAVAGRCMPFARGRPSSRLRDCEIVESAQDRARHLLGLWRPIARSLVYQIY